MVDWVTGMNPAHKLTVNWLTQFHLENCCCNRAR